MTLKEIRKKKQELKAKIQEARTEGDLEVIKQELIALQEAEKILEEQIEAESTEEDNPDDEEKNSDEEDDDKKDDKKDKEDERSLLKPTSTPVEKRSNDTIKILKKVEGNEMNKKKYTVADPEYRNAWAKKLMGLTDDRFTEEEKRALGDAITTTATEYVASTSEVQGINNGGLFIPTSVREEFMERISEASPFFGAIRKLQVAGNIDLPYLDTSDDAQWYTELTETENEGQKYASIQLTGWELAKDIVITWKLEEMAVSSFIDFILDELYEKMGIALIEAALYADGTNKPRGVTHGLTPIKTGETPIDTIIATYKALSRKARIGAKAYISTDVNIEICSYKDLNGNYPFLQGLATNKLVPIEVDPFLHDNDIVVGNPRNYILNETTQLRVDRERTVKGRKTTFGGYAVVDGAPKPGAFAYGQYTPTV